MTKQEFLTQLQRALNGSIDSKEAAALVDYYQEYIEIEMRKGRSQQDVMEELGNPRLIARSIIDVSVHTGYSTVVKGISGKCTDLCREVFLKARKWFENL